MSPQYFLDWTFYNILYRPYQGVKCKFNDFLQIDFLNIQINDAVVTDKINLFCLA